MRVRAHTRYLYDSMEIHFYSCCLRSEWVCVCQLRTSCQMSSFCPLTRFPALFARLFLCFALSPSLFHSVRLFRLPYPRELLFTTATPSTIGTVQHRRVPRFTVLTTTVCIMVVVHATAQGTPKEQQITYMKLKLKQQQRRRRRWELHGEIGRRLTTVNTIYVTMKSHSVGRAFVSAWAPVPRFFYSLESSKMFHSKCCELYF